MKLILFGARLQLVPKQIQFNTPICLVFPSYAIANLEENLLIFPIKLIKIKRIRKLI